MFVSAAFQFKCLWWPFIFRGSFSTPSPGIRSARISPLLSALPKSRTDAQQCRGRAMVSCTPGAAQGSGPPEREGSSIFLPRCQGAGVARLRGKAGKRQQTWRETPLRTRIFSETREAEGRAETKALPEGVARGVGSREPPAAAPRSLPTAAVPHWSFPETQSRQEAASVHVFISHSVRL